MFMVHYLYSLAPCVFFLCVAQVRQVSTLPLPNKEVVSLSCEQVGAQAEDQRVDVRNAQKFQAQRLLFQFPALQFCLLLVGFGRFVFYLYVVVLF